MPTVFTRVLLESIVEFHSRIPGTLSGIAEKTIKITLRIWYMAKAYTRNELNDLGTYQHVNRTLLIPPIHTIKYPYKN